MTGGRHERLGQAVERLSARPAPTWFSPYGQAGA